MSFQEAVKLIAEIQGEVDELKEKVEWNEDVMQNIQNICSKIIADQELTNQKIHNLSSRITVSPKKQLLDRSVNRIGLNKPLRSEGYINLPISEIGFPKISLDNKSYS